MYKFTFPRSESVLRCNPRKVHRSACPTLEQQRVGDLTRMGITTIDRQSCTHVAPPAGTDLSNKRRRGPAWGPVGEHQPRVDLLTKKRLRVVDLVRVMRKRQKAYRLSIRSDGGVGRTEHNYPYITYKHSYLSWRGFRCLHLKTGLTVRMQTNVGVITRLIRAKGQQKNTQNCILRCTAQKLLIAWTKPIRRLMKDEPCV